MLLDLSRFSLLTERNQVMQVRHTFVFTCPLEPLEPLFFLRVELLKSSPRIKKIRKQERTRKPVENTKKTKNQPKTRFSHRCPLIPFFRLLLSHASFYGTVVMLESTVVAEYQHFTVRLRTGNPEHENTAYVGAYVSASTSFARGTLWIAGVRGGSTRSRVGYTVIQYH